MGETTKTVGYKLNDLVWAKMASYCSWPGRVSAPTQQLLKQRKNPLHQCIFFFGTNNYAWIDESNIKPYLEYKTEMVKLGKPKNKFDVAIAEIEAYIKNPAVIIHQHFQQESSMNCSNYNLKPISTPKTKSLADDFDETPTKRRRVSENTSIKVKSPAVSPLPRESPRKPIKVQSIISESIAEPYESNDKFFINNDYAPRNRAARNVIERPTITKPDLIECDLMAISDTLRMKNIKPSKLKFGFLGLGIMGGGIVKNLVNSGHSVVVWNRTKSKCGRFVDAGADEALTPSDVMERADITFSCVSDPNALKETVFGNYGILAAKNLSDKKGFVEMTTIDAETSQDIAAALSDKGARFLEAQIQGSKSQAEEGTLIILAAGDRTLFEDCQTCFEAMGRNSFYLGDVGNATKMNLVLQTMSGICIGGLAEAMALADKSGIQKKDVLEVLSMSRMRSDMLMDKGSDILHGDFVKVNLPLMHLQKDLKLTLNMSDSLNHPMPLTAAANEVYKHTRRLGYGEHDASSVYIRSRY
ncbi:unnamed protein product [Diamesa tonsa]